MYRSHLSFCERSRLGSLSVPNFCQGMRLFACLFLMQTFAAQAFPVRAREEDLRNSNVFINNGELPRDRSIFTIISLLCMMVCSLLLGKFFFSTQPISKPDDGLCNMHPATKFGPVVRTLSNTDHRFAVRETQTPHFEKASSHVCARFHAIRTCLSVHHLLSRSCSRTGTVYLRALRCGNMGLLDLLHAHQSYHVSVYRRSPAFC